MSEYPIVIAPLPDEDGGGYIALYPDLPGCMSDGDTPEEALVNAKDAFDAWIEVQKERGASIPAPGDSSSENAKRMDSLMEALKVALDRVELADQHIKSLEAALEKAIRQNTGSWQPSGMLAHTTPADNIAHIH
jgi:antitoxin HicB